MLVVAENPPGAFIEDCLWTESPAIIDGPEVHPFPDRLNFRFREAPDLPKSTTIGAFETGGISAIVGRLLLVRLVARNLIKTADPELA